MFPPTQWWRTFCSFGPPLELWPKSSGAKLLPSPLSCSQIGLRHFLALLRQDTGTFPSYCPGVWAWLIIQDTCAFTSHRASFLSPEIAAMYSQAALSLSAATSAALFASAAAVAASLPKDTGAVSSYRTGFLSPVDKKKFIQFWPLDNKNIF